MPDRFEYRSGMKSMKALREAKGLSQEKLAELVGASQPQIGRLEKRPDEPYYRPMTIHWAQRLAPFLDCKPLDLLPLDEEPEGLSKKSDKLKENFTRRPYHEGVKDRKTPNQEGKEVDSDAILTAIGRLAVELEGVKAKLKNIEAKGADPNPKKARRG